MAHSVRNSNLENRTKRSKLRENHRPYWVGIGQGLYLGYRKGIKGGAWIVRYYLEKKYITEKIGKADDFQDANNIDVFTYFQAQDRAREYANQMAKSSQGNYNYDLTVSQALSNYLEWFKTHRKSHAITTQVANAHIIPSFGKQLVKDLTTKAIRDWHEKLANCPSKRRSTLIKQNYSPEPISADDIRKRKASANRILTVFKAALNHAWVDGLVSNVEEWRKVKPFRNVDAPKVQYLELSECQRLIDACEPDFKMLVRAALLTGCRYGELIRLIGNDFNAAQRTIFIGETKNGKPRYVPLTQEGAQFFREITTNKQGNSLVFKRNDGESWNTSHQSRRLKDACKIAKIEPAISFHILRHTYGSLLASKGVPLQVIAELLGHSDTRVTSRHYAHLMPSFVSDTLRANLPNFVE